MNSLNCSHLIAAGALALLAFGAPVKATESPLSVANIMLCDKPDQVEAFVTSEGDDLAARLSAINSRYGQESCTVVTAAFYRGEEAKTVLVSDGIVRIVRIEMVGVRQGNAWVRLQAPIEQYAGVREAATDV